MDASAQIRAAQSDRQRKWMAERSAHLEVAQACSDMAAAGSTPASASSLELEARVLDKVTERIQARIQSEAHKDALTSSVSHEEVKSFMEGSMTNHQCPICYELMRGLEHQPTLVFPCGHTFCRLCLSKIRKHRGICPLCRQRISSQAPNVSLAQVIDGFAERQCRLESGEASHVLPLTSDSTPRSYERQYLDLEFRCDVLNGEWREARVERMRLGEQYETAEKVRTCLEGEVEVARKRLEVAQENVRQAQALLDVSASQAAEQQQKCASMRVQMDDLLQQMDLIVRALRPLELERDKARLLSRGE